MLQLAEGGGEIGFLGAVGGEVFFAFLRSPARRGGIGAVEEFSRLVDEDAGFLQLDLEVVADVGDDLGVDGAAQGGLALRLAGGEVGADGLEELVLFFLLLLAELELAGGEDVQLVLGEGEGGGEDGALSRAFFPVDFREIDPVEGLEQGVPLHDLVVEVRQGRGGGFIDDEGEPEAEAGDIDGAGIEIDAVDAVGDDVFLEGGALGGVVEFGIEEGAEVDDLVQHADGEGAGADGGIADFDVFQEGGDGFGVGGTPVAFFPEIARLVDLAEAGEGFVFPQMRFQIPQEGLAAHVGDDDFRRVVGALVLVVLEEVLEDVAEHFRVDADLVILGVVLIDGEVVFGEEGEEVREERRGEVDGLEGGGIGIEEAAVEVGDAGAGEGEEVVFALGVQRLEEEGCEVGGMEGFEFS